MQGEGFQINRVDVRLKEAWWVIDCFIINLIDHFYETLSNMFKTKGRDLLVISKQALADDKALQEEMDLLNEMLPAVEVLGKIASSSEILNLHRHRIISSPEKVAKLLLGNNLRSFVFICNRN